MQGKPVIRNTGVSVELLLRKLWEEATVEERFDAYPRLTKEDIRLASHTPLMQVLTKTSTA